MADRRGVEAFAKVNLGLVVSARDRSGYHPLVSLVQSVSWTDHLELGDSEEGDSFTAVGMETTEDNLAWKAALAVREVAGSSSPLDASLAKSIPIAAGLGGGSADAAAMLALAAEHFGVPHGPLQELALQLGADVPFCLGGGLAVMEGRGERLSWQADVDGYALAVVVPPTELATSDVYARWDSLGEPVGRSFPGGALPPRLRSYEPLRNDLTPAADDLSPLVSEWRGELQAQWDRPVAMTGSGPALFGYFLDEDEAADAVRAIPDGARAAKAVTPVPQGWRWTPVH